MAEQRTAADRVGGVRLRSRWRAIGVGLAIVVVVAVAVALLTRGRSDSGPAVADPLAEALSFAPAGTPAVVQFDVQPSSPQGKQLRELARTFPAEEASE